MAKFQKINRINSGFAAFVIVVIVGAAALIVAISTALLGMRELEIAVTADRGVATKSFTDGCLDSALLLLRQNPTPVNYEFTDSVGQCIITMIDESLGKRRVVARGVVGENERSLEALVTTFSTNRSLMIDNYSI